MSPADAPGKRVAVRREFIVIVICLVTIVSGVSLLALLQPSLGWIGAMICASLGATTLASLVALAWSVQRARAGRPKRRQETGGIAVAPLAPLPTRSNG